MPTILKSRKRPSGIELSWEAQAGKTYHVQQSLDLLTWADFAGPYEGEDALFILPVPAQDHHANFKLVISMPDNYSVPVVAIVALSGEYVKLQWDNLGPSVEPTAHYAILKDGRQYSTRPSTESTFWDTAVASGRTYKYEVRFVS